LLSPQGKVCGKRVIVSQRIDLVTDFADFLERWKDGGRARGITEARVSKHNTATRAKHRKGKRHRDRRERDKGKVKRQRELIFFYYSRRHR
jgi:hypothetical protein